MSKTDTDQIVALALKALGDLDQWHHNCHGASHALLYIFAPECRVARGACVGVGGQHSWLVLGWDCYDMDAIIVDPTLWSYDDSVEGIWVGTMRDGRHTPHGMGNIFAWGRPPEPSGEVVELPEPHGGWSKEARAFLDLIGPLDVAGWNVLAHAPVLGWPAGEIIEALYKRFPAMVPIDIVGMVTDLNPSGIYLPEQEPPDDGQP